MADAQHVLINCSGSGDNTILAAPTDARWVIRVTSYRLSSDAAVVAQWKSGSGTVKDIIYATDTAQGGMSAPFDPAGVFECNPGDALVLNLSTAAKVGGSLTYTILGIANPVGG